MSQGSFNLWNFHVNPIQSFIKSMSVCKEEFIIIVSNQGSWKIIAYKIYLGFTLIYLLIIVIDECFYFSYKNLNYLNRSILYLFTFLNILVVVEFFNI